MTAAPAAPAAARNRRELAVLLAAGVVLGAVAVSLLRVYPRDLEVYMTYGNRVLHGRDDVYVPDPTRELPFTYPPFAALCFAPLSALPRALQTAVTHLLSVAALVRVAWLVAASGAARLARAGEPRPRWTRLHLALAVLALGLACEPVIKTFLYGQVNLVLMWLVAEDLLHPRRRPWTGVGVGLAMGFKLTPGIFLLYLLLTRQWRAAAVAGATGIGTGLLGLLVIPASSWDFWTRAMLHSERVGGLAYCANQSLNGALWRLLGEGGSQALWALGCVALMVLFGAAILAAHRAGDRLAAVALTALLGLAVSPVSWSHHWVWVLAVVPALLLAGGTRRRTWPLAGAWVLACVTWVIWWAPHEEDREYLQPLAMKIVTDAYLVLGILTAVVLLVHLRRAPRAAGDSAETRA